MCSSIRVASRTRRPDRREGAGMRLRGGEHRRLARRAGTGSSRVRPRSREGTVGTPSIALRLRRDAAARASASIAGFDRQREAQVGERVFVAAINARVARAARRASRASAYICAGVPSKRRPQPHVNSVSPVNVIGVTVAARRHRRPARPCAPARRARASSSPTSGNAITIALSDRVACGRRDRLARRAEDGRRMPRRRVRRCRRRGPQW